MATPAPADPARAPENSTASDRSTQAAHPRNTSDDPATDEVHAVLEHDPLPSTLHSFRDDGTDPNGTTWKDSHPVMFDYLVAVKKRIVEEIKNPNWLMKELRSEQENTGCERLHRWC